jgi:hypothetical protein
MVRKAIKMTPATAVTKQELAEDFNFAPSLARSCGLEHKQVKQK